MKPEAFRELTVASELARGWSVEIRAESAAVRRSTRELVEESRELRAASSRVRDIVIARRGVAARR